jgi:NAD(P)H-nitrite reductase large subunit
VGSGKDSDVNGLVRGDSDTWRRKGGATSTVETESGGAHVRLALGDDTIVGAVVMGDQALSFPLQELIGAHADVSAIMPALAAPAAAVAGIIDRFWQDWKAHRVRTP